MTQNQSKLKLPHLISDGMVLQRNEQVKIWGWGPKEEVIVVRFMENVYSTTVEEAGKWFVNINTGSAGGPYDMVIETDKGEERITVRNILLGDVWLCSGQSNMELIMLAVKNKYANEIAEAENDCIRHFKVPVKYDFENQHTDFEAGNWVAANPESVLNFTAAGYFFAAKLYEKYHVPIGLINASLGGAPIEAWLSEDALLSFKEYHERVQKLKDKSYVETLEREDQINNEKWHCSIDKSDIGMQEGEKSFYDVDYDASKWPYIKVPSYWQEEGAGDFNGVVWFRKEIELSSSIGDKPAKLLLGNVVDEDTVYINGIKIGSLPMQYIPRNYDIPEGVLKKGKNTIVVRVVNCSGKGGFYKGKPYQVHIGSEILDLSGEWQYMIGAKSEALSEPNFVMWGPSGLYNCMIAPMTNYAIKGTVWYQGESNTKKPQEYESLFKVLIESWREKWGQGNFPFLYVQLPNYVETYSPAAGKWAELREAQRKTLEVPETGMAVTIDIGEWNDVHPLNKKDVGKRLALTAQKIAYGDKTVIASGPMFQFAKRDGKKIILYFSDIGSGLVVKDGNRLGAFSVAGADKIFVEAEARIEGEQVVVWNDQISDPVHVRYAWGDNPEEANLYNMEGLPASPFTTE